MSKNYIHELKKWPNFYWDAVTIADRLSEVSLKQGRLIGKIERLGFDLCQEAELQTLTEDVLKTSEIEGEVLEKSEVRSSIARHLGMSAGGLKSVDRRVEGIVEMTLDATLHFKKPLTSKRLFAWHKGLFESGVSGFKRIRVGAWRSDAGGPMQVVSGPFGKERIHYEAPSASRLKLEMTHFTRWFNDKKTADTILKSSIAHLWFVTLHPFDDGNGRIARAISDMVLARSENSPRRFYSMSSQIRKERSSYYDILEKTQKGSLDISAWIHWFLNCLEHAFEGTETILEVVLKKDRFWEKHRQKIFNDRQKAMLIKLLDGFDGKLTSSKWAKIMKCSQDTASRDINGLLDWGILIKDAAGGRSTSYEIVI